MSEPHGYASVPRATRGLGGLERSPHRHLCAFFDSADDEYRTLLPFVGDGLQAGQRAFHLVDPGAVAAHRSALAMSGIDLPAAERRGQVEIVTWQQAALASGRLDQDRVLAFIAGALEQGRRHYPLTRVVAQMNWAADRRREAERVVQLEARLDALLTGQRDVLVCVYHAHRFSGEMVVAMMQTHPLVLLGGALHESPIHRVSDR
jgi:hypothetical protein